MRKRIMTSFAALPLAISGGTVSAEGKPEGGEGTNLVKLDPISVPIIESDRLAGALRITVVLDATDPAAAARLGDRQPEIREAAMAATLEFARLHASGFRPVNAELLDHDLKAALGSVDPGIAQVLITEVSAKNA